MVRAWGRLIKRTFNYVIKAQLETLVLTLGAEFGRHRSVGIQDRNHMAHPGLAMRRQLVDATNRDLERSPNPHCPPAHSVPGMPMPRQTTNAT
jgi:hypothetical protein